MSTTLTSAGLSLTVTDTSDGGATIAVTPLALPVTPAVVTVAGPLTMFGDSTGGGIVSNVASQLGVTADDQSVSGDQAADQATHVYSYSPTTPHAFIMGTGINDERVYGTDANRLRIMADAESALVAWLALPESQKIRMASAAPALTGSGWTLTQVYGLGRRSNMVGDTATVTIAGRTLYVGVLQQDGQTGAADLYIDGRYITSITCYGQGGALIATQNGTSYTAKLIRVPNLPAGSHTVSIVNRSGGLVYLDWVGGTDGAVSTARPVVFVGNCIPGAFGYPSGGSDAAVAAVNTWIKALVEQLADDGLNVHLVDLFSAITDPPNDISSDGIHPTAQGYSKLFTAYTTAIKAAVTW